MHVALLPSADMQAVLVSLEKAPALHTTPFISRSASADANINRG